MKTLTTYIAESKQKISWNIDHQSDEEVLISNLTDLFETSGAKSVVYYDEQERFVQAGFDFIYLIEQILPEPKYTVKLYDDYTFVIISENDDIKVPYFKLGYNESEWYENHKGKNKDFVMLRDSIKIK